MSIKDKETFPEVDSKSLSTDAKVFYIITLTF
jgi:hypothetical protein